jgi:hypothetical protein
MAAWAAFAREHLQNGDILFRRGRACGLGQQIASRILTGISDSRFTHNSLVLRQGDGVFVYDVQPKSHGVRKIPFEFWMLETVPGTLAVKRLLPAYRHCIPQALAWCEQAWLRQPPFDFGLRLDDERLYCSEMIEKAFRSAGLALSDPTPIRCLPRFRRYQVLGWFVERFTQIRLDEPAFALGNACYGTYGSPYLELVLGGDPCPNPQPPLCPPVPFPSGATECR